MNKVRIADIKEVICSWYGITSDELVGRRKFQTIARPRRIAIFLARDLAGAQFRTIGKAFGGRSGQIAHVCYWNVRDEIKADDRTAAEIRVLRQACATHGRAIDVVQLFSQQPHDRQPSEKPGRYVPKKFGRIPIVRPISPINVTRNLMGDPAPGRSALFTTLKGK